MGLPPRPYSAIPLDLGCWGDVVVSPFQPITESMGVLGSLVVSIIVLTQTTLGQSTRFRRFEPPAPRLTFRSDKDLVLINATVFDRNGRVITDLGLSNFRLFEEKRPVEIRQLSLE